MLVVVEHSVHQTPGCKEPEKRDSAQSQPSLEARRWYVIRLLCRALAFDAALQAGRYQVGDSCHE
jgi:hypothetical protein